MIKIIGGSGFIGKCRVRGLLLTKKYLVSS